MAEFDATAGGLPGLPLPARGTDVAVVSRNGVQLARLDLRDWPLSNPVAQAISQRLGPNDLATINGQSLIQPGGNIVIAGGGSGGGTWGSITGTLSDQTDLQTALNARPVFEDFATINGQAITEGGDIELAGSVTSLVNLGNVSGTIDVDVQANAAYQFNATANVIVNLVNPPAAGVFFPVTLLMTRTTGSGALLSFAQTVNFLGGSNPPVLVDNLTATASIATPNGGATYFGQVNGLSFQNQASGESTTWNPSDFSGTPPLTLSNSNLTVEMTTATAAFRSARAFGGKNSGKWYYVLRCDVAQGDISGVRVVLAYGIASAAASLSSQVGSVSNSASLYFNNGGNAVAPRLATFDDGVSTTRAGFGAPASGFFYGLLFDASTGQGWFTVNGSVAFGGDPEAGTGAHFTVTPGVTYFPMVSLFESGTNANAGAYTIMNEIQTENIGILFPSWAGKCWTA